jgi:hypothetical protein
MVLNHSFGDRTLSREKVLWPGDAVGVREWIRTLHDEWAVILARSDADDLHLTSATRWPFTDRPFGDLIAWVNVELTKNAAEIGYARFLYSVAR